MGVSLVIRKTIRGVFYGATLATLLLLAACGARGHDFGRPDLEQSFVIGRTTEADITNKLGVPTQVQSNIAVPLPGFGAMPRADRTLVYLYQPNSAWFPPPSGPPMRVASYGLVNGTLQSEFFFSTFLADQRDFDVAAARALLNHPDTTLNDAVRVLGPPEVLMSADHGVTGAGWYVLARSKEPDRHLIMTKVFAIRFGPDGRALDHRLDVHGEP